MIKKAVGFAGRTAILSALPQEQSGLREAMANACVEHYAGREFVCGDLYGQRVVLALSRIGKVAAAITAAALIERFRVEHMVFTGVAGGVGDGVRVGDVVIGGAYLQHDMDCTPLFPRYEIPLSGRSVFVGDPALTQRMVDVCQLSLSGHRHEGRPVTVHCGLIASGDQFVNGADSVASLVGGLRAAGHDPLAVEMEGAAVAQVCADYGVPFVAMRTISDRADDTAHTDFITFVNAVASVYAQKTIAAFLRAA